MHFISVDYQKDFGAEGGKWYLPRPCERFISEEFIPFIRNKKLRISEIVSDYRLPRPSETLAYCIPGTAGYESLIPDDIKTKNPWIKCMNSPVWVRENAGDQNKPAGEPYACPDLFSGWLKQETGSPEEAGEVVLFGLTLDCCVLSLAQELYFRGYKARYLVEGTDTYNGTAEEKENLFITPLPMWGRPIEWSEVKKSYSL